MINAGKIPDKIITICPTRTLDVSLCSRLKVALGKLSPLRVPLRKANLFSRGFRPPVVSQQLFSFYSNSILTLNETRHNRTNSIYEQLKNAIEYGTAIESRKFGTGLVLRASA